MKRVKEFVGRMYFGKELPFNYRIYMIFFFECLGISILSATTNTALGKGLFGVIFQWTYILLCIVVMFIPLKWRMAMSKPLLIFVTFVYVPFLFFQTAGYDGTAGLFALLGVFLLTVVFSGRSRTALVVLNIVLWVAICVVQYLCPQLVVPHGAEQAKFVDYIVAMTLSSAGLAVFGVYIRNTFAQEQARIQALLKSEEEHNKQLEELTYRDPLTKAYNRRFLTSFLTRELEIVRREGKNLCVMQLDIDHFKQVNDSWGHGVGDKVLVKFSATVQDNLRRYDVLARIGGEEFVVLLSTIEMAKAQEIAGRILRAIEQTNFGDGLRVTVSIGLVKAREDDDVDSLLNRADKQLYEAKHSGRNQLVVEQD